MGSFLSKKVRLTPWYFDRKSAFLDGVIFKQKRKVNPFLSKKVRLTPWYFDRKSAFLDGLLFQQKSKVNPLVF